jgi:adenosylcobinamide-GDP ribazoletransferase
LPSIKVGLGERFAWRCPTWVIALWSALLLPACGIYPALLAAPVLILAWRAYLLKRLGGMSGDALGAGVEWLESGLLLALVLAW